MGYPSLSTICPVIAFDDKNQLFLNEDKTVGFGFMCRPLPGASSTLQSELTSLLSDEYPKGTIMSFMLFRSPDVDENLSQMLNLRGNYYHDLLSPIVVDRAKFLRHHSINHLISNTKSGIYDAGMIVDVKLIITVKVPVSNGLEPSDKEIYEIGVLRDKIQSGLINFAPRILEPQTWIRVMSTLVKLVRTCFMERS